MPTKHRVLDLSPIIELHARCGTQAQMAERMGITKGEVSKILQMVKGENCVLTKGQLEAFARAGVRLRVSDERVPRRKRQWHDHAELIRDNWARTRNVDILGDDGAFLVELFERERRLCKPPSLERVRVRLLDRKKLDLAWQSGVLDVRPWQEIGAEIERVVDWLGKEGVDVRLVRGESLPILCGTRLDDLLVRATWEFDAGSRQLRPAIRPHVRRGSKSWGSLYAAFESELPASSVA